MVQGRYCQTEAQGLEEKEPSNNCQPNMLVFEDGVDEFISASMFVEDFDGFVGQVVGCCVKTGQFLSRQFIWVEIVVTTGINWLYCLGKFGRTIGSTAFKLLKR